MPEPIESSNRQIILLGRKAVDAYRTAHAQLHNKPYYRGVHDAHTPLLEQMLDKLSKQGFNSLEEFFNANEELNIGELNKAYFRSGECNQCGKCCETCEYYQGKGVCAVYDKRPEVCINYPTAKDFLIGLFTECSYKFTKTSYKPTIDAGWQ